MLKGNKHVNRKGNDQYADEKEDQKKKIQDQVERKPPTGFWKLGIYSIITYSLTNLTTIQGCVLF